MSPRKVALLGPYFETRFKKPDDTTLAQQVKDSARWRGIIDPKFGLTYPEMDEIPFGPELGERWTWPPWMQQRSRCEACGWQGPFETKEPCYGRQQSHVMRS